MPPRRHRRGGGRRYGGGTVFYDEGPMLEDVVLVEPSQLDAIMVPPTDDVISKSPGAGDIFPTLVTPNDAKAYMDQVNTGYVQLQTAVLASAVPDTFKTPWALQMAAWTAFYTGAGAGVGWLNTTAVMQQTDRFQSELITWRRSFAAAGGNPPGPDPTPAGQGTGGGATVQDFSKLAIAVGVGAAILIFGPTIAKSFH